MVKSQHTTTPPDSPNPTQNVSSAPTHTDPAATLAQLWPRLDARDRRTLYALALGFWVLGSREVA